MVQTDPLLEQPISKLVPHVFRRPLLSVNSGDSLVQVGIFLAIGPQIYVDGLVVTEGGKAVGRIGGQHVIRYILDHLDSWPGATASDIMDRQALAVDADAPMSKALGIFAETHFAFVPITVNGSIATSLSIRDTLRIAASPFYKLTTPVSMLRSPLVSAERDISIGNALQMMLENHIRNVVLMHSTETDDSMKIVNDRKILEFLLSHEGRQMMTPKSIKKLYDLPVVESLSLSTTKQVPPDLPASTAAELLLDVNMPCLLSDGYIVTPWDIVMKGFAKLT